MPQADDYRDELQSLQPQLSMMHLLVIYNALESARAANNAIYMMQIGVGLGQWHCSHIQKMLQVVCILF